MSCQHPQDFLQLWECLPLGTCLHQSTLAQFELQFHLILLRAGNGCFEVWYLWTWKAPFLLAVHWAGQCLSLPIKNVIKDLTSCKKCIKKTEKQRSRFPLVSLLFCSGFYFCASLSCLSQKSSHLNFPHVLTCLIAKHWALKTKQTNKKNHCLWFKRNIDCPWVPTPRILAAFCQHQEWGEGSQRENKFSNWKEKKLSQENSCAPSFPVPQLHLNKWSADLLLTFPVYSKQHFP